MTTKENTINKIKERGYWLIKIHPTEYVEKLIPSRTSTKEFVQKAIVELRGWDYPHFNDKDGPPYQISNGIEKVIDWENHIEFWRMTQSANFFHMLALREDWLKDTTYYNIWSHGNDLKDKKILGVLGSLYTFVEIFEFTKRLVEQKCITSNISIEITLHDIYERYLYVDHSNRVPFFSARKCQSESPWVWKQEYNLTKITNVLENSLEAYLDLIDLFGWENPPIELFKDDINKFLEGKI